MFFRAFANNNSLMYIYLQYMQWDGWTLREKGLEKTFKTRLVVPTGSLPDHLACKCVRSPPVECTPLTDTAEDDRITGGARGFIAFWSRPASDGD